MKINLKLLF